MSFFSKKPKESLSLIMDIQSSVVRGSLVHLKGSDLPHIVWTLSIDIPYRPDAGTSYLVDGAVKAASDIALAAKVFMHDSTSHSGQLPKSISRAHCVLSSPWIASQARTVSQDFQKDTKITRDHVEDIIKSERAAMSQKTNDRMVNIEEKIFDVRINGYSIPEWNGAAGRTFEASFAVSVAAASLIKRFSGAIKACGINGSHIDFHSSLLLQHIGLNSILPMPGPHMLIHAHGELTDIVISTGDTCVLFGSHPTGVRGIVRSLSSSMAITEQAADSLLSMFENNQTDALHGSGDAEKIRAVMSAWTAECLKVTSLVSAQYAPSRGMVSARFHEDSFRNALSAAYPSIKIENLPSEKILTLATFDPRVEKLRLTVLYIAAIHSLEMI